MCFCGKEEGGKCVAGAIWFGTVDRSSKFFFLVCLHSFKCPRLHAGLLALAYRIVIYRVFRPVNSFVKISATFSSVLTFCIFISFANTLSLIVCISILMYFVL